MVIRQTVFKDGDEVYLGDSLVRVLRHLPAKPGETTKVSCENTDGGGLVVVGEDQLLSKVDWRFLQIKREALS